MIKDTNKINMIKKIIKKSERALNTAKNNFNDEDYESASSRAYYALFHIMQAALLSKDLSYSKHSGVISGFSKEFIKPGIFPKELSKIIRKLFKDREIGDYSYSISISDKEANEDIKSSEKIVREVKAYLEKNILKLISSPKTY